MQTQTKEQYVTEYKLKTLRLAVAAMRENQRLFFATKSPKALRDSKELEIRVDKLIAEP